jgi:hypothetical protein
MLGPRLAMTSLGTPPLDIVAQLLFFLLQFYVEEKPFLASMLILILRILRWRWIRLSCHVL